MYVQLLEQETERIERAAVEKSRRDYITFVTDEIMEHAFDMGVTVMMPHTVSKDLIKRIPDYGEKFGLTPKDKRQVIIQPGDLEVLHFEIDEPLSPFMLEVLHAKEAMLVCWKNAETELRPIEEMLEKLRSYLSDPQPIEEDPSVFIPAILKTLTLELKEEEYARISGEEYEEPTADLTDQVEEAAAEVDNVVVVSTDGDAQPSDADPLDTAELQPDDGEKPTDDTNQKASPGESVEPTASEIVAIAAQAPPEKPTVKGIRSVNIPPVWTPSNKRATAAFIYLYFRQVYLSKQIAIIYTKYLYNAFHS